MSSRRDARIDALAQAARALEAAANVLVTTAPPAPAQIALAREPADRLAAGCAENAAPEEAALAAACAACLRGLQAGQIAPGPVLMYLASSARTLADALDARAGGAIVEGRGLVAARHELESFAPSEHELRARSAPDVAVARLRRGDS